jgi:hypothetical protein
MRLSVFALAAAALAAPALAGDAETVAQCELYVAQNGGDASGCPCLGEAAEKDAELADDLAAIDSPAALEAAPERAKAAIRACFPQSNA